MSAQDSTVITELERILSELQMLAENAATTNREQGALRHLVRTVDRTVSRIKRTTERLNSR